MLEKVPKNDKPQDKASTKSQGAINKGYGNDTTLKESKSRYEKGMDLYREGKVKLGANGLFKVSGYYECDTERMTCTCPDYKTRKETCKHLFAAMLFVKNRGKQKIEHLNDGELTSAHHVEKLTEGQGKNQVTPSCNLKNGKGDWLTEVMNDPTYDKPADISQQVDRSDAGRSTSTGKPFDRQSIITRLAVLNTATEILKTHRKPIEFNDIVSLASQLEQWALGT